MTKKHHHIRRRSLIALLYLILLLFGYMRWVEPRWLEIKHVNIDLPDGRKYGLKILHLTDFHWSRYVTLEFIDQAIKRGLELDPDVIVLTGDYVSGRFGPGFTGSDLYQTYREILRQLSRHAPTFACMGNHDGGVWAGFDPSILRNLLQESGIIVLNNESRQIEIKNQRLTLIGLGDFGRKILIPTLLLMRLTQTIATSRSFWSTILTPKTSLPNIPGIYYWPAIRMEASFGFLC